MAQNPAAARYKSTRPTNFGHYWFRRPGESWYIVRVFENYQELLFQEGISDKNVLLLESIKGEWIGPISRPKESAKPTFAAK